MAGLGALDLLLGEEGVHRKYFRPFSVFVNPF
jgi:hypothetical protein